MGDALFDLIDFAPPAPAWALACIYCTSAAVDGVYDEKLHLHNHLPLTCAVCRETSPNRLLFEMNHGTTLGGCWQRDALVCTSLHLRLNHLTYALRKGEPPEERDWTAIELGWRLAPDGTAVAPAGWPRGVGERSTDPKELHDCHAHISQERESIE